MDRHEEEGSGKLDSEYLGQGLRVPERSRSRVAGRKDGLFVGNFRGDVDPKEGLHPANCRNPRERRVLEFLMPILYPEKPKRISLTMANTLFGALSGVRLVNWGLLIHEIVGRALPNIGKKPSYLSPFTTRRAYEI